MFFTSVRVRSHERGLWFRDGEFHRLLEPGTHRLWRGLFSRGRDRVAVVSTLPTRFRHDLLDVMLRQVHVRDALHVVDLTDVERALVWKDERLAYVLGTGRHAFWKSPARLFVETFRVDRDDGRFAHPRLPVVLGHSHAGKFFDVVQVNAGTQAVLYRDGVVADRLAAGVHVYWKGAGRLKSAAVDVRERETDVRPRCVLSAERTCVRVGLCVTWRVGDVMRAVASGTDVGEALRRAARVAVRAAAARHPVDAMLSEECPLGEDVCARLAERAGELGVVVRRVDVTSVAPARDGTVRTASAAPRVRRSRELGVLTTQLRDVGGGTGGVGVDVGGR